VRPNIQSTLESVYGNPSSAHALDAAAKALVETARRRLAAASGSSEPSSIVFAASNRIAAAPHRCTQRHHLGDRAQTASPAGALGISPQLGTARVGIAATGG
jgi:hypothetical protein